MTRRRTRPAAAAFVVALVVGLLPTSHVTPAFAADPEIAHWTFDEGAGTVAGDTVGTHDGTLVGDATWDTAGNPEGAAGLAVHGAGGVNAAHAVALEPTGAFSITLWAKVLVDQTTSMIPLASKNDYYCNPASWGLRAFPSGGVQGIIKLSGGSDVILSSAADDAPWDGTTWHALAMVADPAAGTAALYIDGVLRSQVAGAPFTVNYGATGRTARTLRLGEASAWCTAMADLNGGLDDVRLYSHALSVDEVRALLPDQPTTTTVTVSGNGGPIGATAYVDDWTRFHATIAPAPGEVTEVTWLRTVNGGPETPFWTTHVPSGSGRAEVDELGIFPAGSYTVRATWPGAGIWLPSGSDPVAFSVVRRPVVIRLTAQPADILPSETTRLTARLSTPSNGEAVTGPVDFFDVTDGGSVPLGTVEAVYQGSEGVAILDVPGTTAGTRTFQARFAKTDALAGAVKTVTVVVGRQLTRTEALVVNSTVVSTERPKIVMSIRTERRSAGSPPAKIPTGALRVKLASTGQVLISRSITAIDQSFEVLLPVLPLGSHDLVVEYAGDASYEGSSATIDDLQVVPDTVNATGVGLSATTFYPYRDTYRDSVAIKGQRHEPISVQVEIFAPSGGRIVNTSVPRATGAYSVGWDGRNTAGSIRAEGVYRIVQTLRDAAGTTASFTHHVTLDHARITYTTGYVTRVGHQVAAQGDDGPGSITLSSAGGYAKLVGGWVGVGYEFTLPSALIYQSIEFQVKLKGIAYAGPAANQIAVQSFEACPYHATADWDAGCFESWSGVGNQNVTAWFTTEADAVRNRSGRIVRGMVSVNSGTVYVYSARFKVVYGRLTG